MASVASRLYRGELQLDVVGRARLWFTISGIAMAISLIALFYPGLNFSIEFKGGAQFSAFAQKPLTVTQVQDAIGSTAQQVQLTSGKSPQVIVQTPQLTETQVAQIRADLVRLTGSTQVSVTSIGSTWGSVVTRKALEALAVFLAAITVYVSIRFEFKMAVSALIALLHDLLITAGVYAIVGLTVSPATVIALLTILGYSLYDTVVVFDKVRENTEGMSALSRNSYSELANRAVNQTVVRSINTSLASLLPVGAMLIVGFVFIGAQTIQQLSLALLVGITSGTYSSIFIATPVLATWKETEPKNQQLRARLARQQAMAPAPAPAGNGRAGAGRGRGRPARTPAPAATRAQVPVTAIDPAMPQGTGLISDDEFEAGGDGAVEAGAGLEVAGVAAAGAAAMAEAGKDAPDQPAEARPRPPRPAQQRGKGGSSNRRSTAAKRRRR